MRHEFVPDERFDCAKCGRNWSHADHQLDGEGHYTPVAWERGTIASGLEWAHGSDMPPGDGWRPLFSMHMPDAVDALIAVLGSWVNGRRVADGIPQPVLRKAMLAISGPAPINAVAELDGAIRGQSDCRCRDLENCEGMAGYRCRQTGAMVPSPDDAAAIRALAGPGDKG